MAGATVDQLSTLVLAAVMGVLGLVVMWKAPRYGFAVWVGSVSFLPVWVGVQARGIFFPAAALGAVLLGVALVWSVRGLVLSVADGVVALLVLVGLVSLGLGGPSVAFAALVVLASYWLTGYVLGRIVGLRLDEAWTYGVVSVALTLAALLAIIEFASGRNLFVEIHASNAQYATWGQLRSRGGVPRSEGAFGNSIALGSSLVMAIPLTLGSRFPTIARLIMVIVLLGGILTTFSRVSILGAGIALVLSIAFIRDILTLRARVTVGLVTLVGAVVIFPPVSNVFLAAGDEALASSSYRGSLVSLVPAMNPLGVAPTATRASDGTLYFGSFRSIDSQLILSGLTSGWLVVLVSLVVLLGAMLIVLAGRGTPASVAVVSQIPALISVALITQYAILFWFMVGLAATTQVLRSTSSADLRRPTVLPPTPADTRAGPIQESPVS